MAAAGSLAKPVRLLELKNLFFSVHCSGEVEIPVNFRGSVYTYTIIMLFSLHSPMYVHAILTKRSLHALCSLSVSLGALAVSVVVSRHSLDCYLGGRVVLARKSAL